MLCWNVQNHGAIMGIIVYYYEDLYILNLFLYQK